MYLFTLSNRVFDRHYFTRKNNELRTIQRCITISVHQIVIITKQCTLVSRTASTGGGTLRKFDLSYDKSCPKNLTTARTIAETGMVLNARTCECLLAYLFISILVSLLLKHQKPEGRKFDFLVCIK